MLSPRWKKVLRDLWLHKARTSLVISSICVGIIGAGSVLNAWSLVRRGTHDEYGASNPPSAVIRVDEIDDALLAKVRAMPALAAVQTRRVVMGSIQTRTGWQGAMLMSTSDFAANRIGVIKQDRGAWPPPDNAIIVEHSSVEFAEVAIGDSLVLQVGDAPQRRMPVSGIARDVGLAPGWMEHIVYLFVTPATLASLGVPTSMNEFQILVRDRSLDREALKAVANDVRSIIEGAGHKVSDVNVPVPGRHIHAAQIDSLLYTQGAFGLLALFLSAILVVNLVSAMLTGQVREIGVMKAIGARADQLAAMYLTLALILGLIACAISLPIAALLGRLYAGFTADLLNFDVAAFSIPAWSFGLQLVVGSLLPVIAAAFPVARGCRISVSNAMRDFGTSGRGESGSFVMGIRGFSRPVLLSLRNAFRRRERMLLTLATLSVGGAVYLGALNLRAAVIGAVDLLFASQKFDVSFRLAQPHSADSLVAIASRVATVTSAEAWVGARANLTTAEGKPGNSFVITAPPLNSKLLVVTVDSGPGLSAGPVNGLIVNARLQADEPELALGKEITLMIAGRPAQWRVVGIADTGPQPASYSTREIVEHVKGMTGATTLVVATSASTPSSKLEMIRQLRSDLTDAGIEVSSSQSKVQSRAVIEDHLLMVAGFLGNMSLLMIVVGALGLASTMSLAVLERTREIGVLRAIGARHGSILAMIQTEGLVIAVLSWALAIPLSLPMSIMLGNAFGRVMLKVPVHLLPNGRGVLQWLAVVVGVSIIACAWPARRATRITTAATLAYE